MKPRRFFILLMMALCWIVLPASASRLGDIRVNARFLTDRMAYELRLSNRQYNDVFEINYDFFYNVDPYIDRMSYGDPYALDMYYRFLDERNDDLRWVLSRRNYVRFMKLEHFFLPIYAVNRICYIRVYNIYPNRTHFYFGCPSHYYSYRGGHCRHHYGGISFYERNYRNHYRHSVYNGHYQSGRTRTRGRDFPQIDASHHSGRVDVGRPQSEVRRRQIESGYSSESVRNPESVRNSARVRHNPESVRNSTSVRHRSESVRHNTESVNRHSSRTTTRSTRNEVRRSDSRTRSQSGSSTSRGERSERRGARER